MSTVTDEVAWSDLLDVGNDVCYSLPEHLFDQDKAFPLVAAALRAKGWHGRPAWQVMFARDGDVPYERYEQVAKAGATIEDPWSKLREHTEDRGQVNALERLLGEQTHHSLVTPEPGGTEVDLDVSPVAPRWIAKDFLVRGKTHLLSGPTHAFKSGLFAAMMTADLKAQPFLGRDVRAGNWMVIDAENSREDVAHTRRALGLTNTDVVGRVHTTLRDARVNFTEPHWQQWLRAEIERFRPSVLVIDTVARCFRTPVLDNDAVVELYADHIVPLVDEFDLALVLTHHERKGGASGNRAEAAMGAGQWAGQVEQHLTIAPTTKLRLTPQEGGTTATHRAFALRRPKGRALMSDAPEHFDVRGVLDSDGALMSMTVSSPHDDPTDEQQLVAACDRPVGRSELARALALNATGTRFRNALEKAVDSGDLVKSDDGLYERATG